MPVLSEDDADPDQVEQFLCWYGDAGTDAVTLVTAPAEAVPSGRMVLLKGVDQRGSSLTQLRERQGPEPCATNPRAALVFFWPPYRQVRASGTVPMVGPEGSEGYWTRPRASQLGAWPRVRAR